MSVTDLTASTQDYLKAIWTLQEYSEDPVTAKVLAEKIGVRLSSASDAVRKLADQQLVIHQPYGSVELTAEGTGYAIDMVRRHRLIEAFLVETLGYRWDEVHEEADALEHAVSDMMIDRIDQHLGFPTRDPHGDPIPRRDGSIDAPELDCLSVLHVGDRARIERISDADPAMLQFFARQGLHPGVEFTIVPSAPYSGSMAVSVGEESSEPVWLGVDATNSIWVYRLSSPETS